MNDERLKNEQAFHDHRFGGEDVRDKVGKFYAANKHLDDRYVELVASLSKGKKLLEYGCGSGSGSVQWLEFGAELTGIDISPEGIKAAQEAIAKTKYKAEYFVMNAEDLTFEDNYFDVIVGSAIIHHLILDAAYKELARVLKKDGHLILSEPLGHNPIINLYRKLTPQMRTVDEHPLLMKDLDLLKKYFQNVEIEYFSLTTIMAVPFRNSKAYEPVSNFFRKIDELIFKIPFMRKFAWYIIINASNPKK
jgi:ubiquinone/menaquinone biosynthesis C-methylase UbiE